MPSGPYRWAKSFFWRLLAILFLCVWSRSLQLSGRIGRWQRRLRWEARRHEPLRDPPDVAARYRFHAQADFTDCHVRRPAHLPQLERALNQRRRVLLESNDAGGIVVHPAAAVYQALPETLEVAVLGKPPAPLFHLAVVTALSSLSIMAFSVLVAASLRTGFDLVTIGSFPFFILMFFSGGMFPLPNVRIFDLGSRSVNLNDILPTPHTIDAYNSILNYDAGLGAVGYEMAAITVLTVLFFAMGTWVFSRRHMRAA